MMRYRTLGRTGIEVSEIGFGAWGIGGVTPGATSYGRTSDGTSIHALERAFDNGITFFDTSSVYGHGHSEELIGRVIRGRRDKVVIATKAGLDCYGEPADFTPAHTRASLERSLRRLGTDYVDLLQLHNPAPDLLEQDDKITGLAERLKREGKIRAFGVSVRAPKDGLVALGRMKLDAIQVNLHLMDQRAAECGLLESAVDTGCAVIARTPLCFGFLAASIDEDTIFSPDDHRSRWPRHQIAQWARGGATARAFAAREGVGTAGQLALRFCLSFPAVASAIPGMLTPYEVDENASASALTPLSISQLSEIRALYKEVRFGMDKPVDPGKLDSAKTVS